MQGLVSLAETDFKHVPRPWTKEFTAYVDSFFGSTLIEQLNNDGRSRAASNRNGQINPKGLWQTCSMATPTLTEFGRPHVPITSAGQAAAAKTIPNACFDYTDKNCSIAASDYADLRSKRPSYPTQAPPTENLAPMATKLMVRCKGDWNLMQLAYFSLLPEIGDLLRKSGSTVNHLVLSVSQFHVSTCTAKVKKIGEHHYLDTASFTEENAHHEIVHIINPKEWRVVGTEMCAPSENDTAADLDLAFGPFVKLNAGESLLKSSARKGFRNISATLLKNMHKELTRDNPPQRGKWPRGEGPLAFATVKLQHPTWTTPEIKAAVEFRKKPLDLAFLLEKSPVLEEEFKSFLDEDEEDDEDIHETLKQIKQTKKDINYKKEVRTKELAKLQAETALITVHEAGAHVPRQRNFCPLKTIGYTVAAAKRFVPFGIHIHKDPKENRWRCNGLGETTSKSYGRGTGLSDYAAMVIVLREAWSWHAKGGGNPCEFEFDAIPLPGGAASSSSGAS